MDNETSNLKGNSKWEKTPKKVFNTEGNKNYEKFKPYYPKNIFNHFSISKIKNQLKPFNNKMKALSVDKRNAKLPLLNQGQQFLSKQRKEWSNVDIQNMGNIYENLNLNNPYERDNLLMEIYHTENDMNKTNKEINELKKMFDILEKENLANKFMINELLNKNKKIKIESNNNTNNNTNNIDTIHNNETIDNKSKIVSNYENNNNISESTNINNKNISKSAKKK